MRVMKRFFDVLWRYGMHIGLPCLLLSACGASVESAKFYEAARRQYALENQAIQIFERGPTWDGANPLATALSNNQAISKTFVSLLGLTDPAGALRGFPYGSFGYGIHVQYSKTNTQSPIFNTWAGRPMEWNSQEFKAFMLYAHMSKAYAFAFDNLLSLQAAGVIKSTNYPVKGFAATAGHVGNTKFTYKNGLALNFFQHDQDASLSKLNMVDEADAIYHEYAHYLQHIYNTQAINVPISDFESGTVSNPDLDAIIEGTADYFVVAITKSERILSYLENNLALLNAGVIVREGTSMRSMSQSWSFPDTYVAQPHMDGRVIASAVNDIRKYISGFDVRASCNDEQATTPCYVKSSVSISGVNDIWAKAFEISMLAFGGMSNQSTYRHYAHLLITKTIDFLHSQGCDVVCQANKKKDLIKILHLRGLLDSQLSAAQAQAIYPVLGAGDVGTNDTHRIIVGSDIVGNAFNFVPFDPDRGLSDANMKLSECEMAVVFPDIYNNTNAPLLAATVPATDFYNIRFRVKSTTNLQEVKDDAGMVVDSLTNSNGKWKFWGILKPGERGLTNLFGKTSDWFKTTKGSHFSQPPTLNNFPVPWGYLVSVPRSRLGQPMTITWEVRMTPKNANSHDREISFERLQNLTIDTDLTFCN